MITIVDCGMGNVQAFLNIYKRLNVAVSVASSAADLTGASKIVLPGVGAFDWAMTRLNASGMRAALEELVVGKRCPVLGVCVGMQMMAQRSEEGTLQGLGWIDGVVKKFDTTGTARTLPLPHMGWNDVDALQTACLFEGLGEGARYYFLHSYYLVPHHREDVLAVTDYNGRYTCAARCQNVFGVQFHPEKSHRWGIQLLKNFAEL